MWYDVTETYSHRTSADAFRPLTERERPVIPHEFEDDLLWDPSFRALLARFSREAMTWEEFLDHPLPRNMSATRTWSLLNELSRDIGVPVPIPDLDDNEYWYRRTYRLTDVVTVVSCACQKDSRLYRTLTASSGHHFLLKARVQETIAAVRLDGFDIDEDSARMLLRMDRAPQNAVERLMANTFSAMDRLVEFVDEPFSNDLFEHLLALLLEGVDANTLKTSAPAMGLVSFDYEDARTEKSAQRQLGYITRYANHEAGDEYDHPLLRALLLTDVFRLYRPFGNMSSQVGRLTSRLYELKHDLPVVGLLPISRAKLEWEKGSIEPPAVTYGRGPYKALSDRSPGDLTAYQTLSAELALLTLRGVERYVDTWERRDEEMREILRSDPLLNQRQRSILARALRVPDSEFRIRYHQHNHNIAYTTARRDLLELADKDYLSLKQRGKAFIFVPAPKLNDLTRDEAAPPGPPRGDSHRG